jgi:TRAP-type C4-dicarboxylate transport system substrate-binding protein
MEERMISNNKVFDSLTEEDKKKMEIEFMELQNWYVQEHKRIEKEIEIEEIQKYGKPRTGLDVNQYRFGNLIDEHRKRFHELKKKYGFD